MRHPAKARERKLSAVKKENIPTLTKSKTGREPWKFLLQCRISIFHYRGEYRIRTEWEGSTLLYEVFLGKGLAAMGFDMLSGDEQTAASLADAMVAAERELKSEKESKHFARDGEVH